MSEEFDTKGFFYTEADQMRKYFKDKTHIEFSQDLFWLEGKLHGTPLISMQKKIFFPFLEKDEKSLNLWTKEGNICLKITHKQILDLKRQIFIYEAFHLGRGPHWFGKKIKPKDMKWDFKNK